jgi:adenosylcobinamide-GDP ribazoletransferase
MNAHDTIRARLGEVVGAFALLTRLPVSFLPALPQAQPGASVWAYPLVGATVGALGGAVYWLAHGLSLPPALATLFALGAMILFAGALHEDGLADAADALAGQSPAQSLTIMRDHRIGTYGALALLLTLGLRATAIALLAKPGLVMAALLAAGAASRSSAGGLMAALPHARPDGLSIAAGRPSLGLAAAGIGLAFVIGLLLLPFGTAAGVVASAILVASLVGWLAWARLGGQTGDVLGACCQLSECAALTLLVALAA